MGPGAPILITPGDEVDRFILLSNSHDGRGALSLRFTPIRVVCHNTLNLALKDGEHVLNLRHSKKMRERLADHQIEFFLRVVEETFAEAAEQFRKLAGTKATTARRESYLKAMFPRTTKQERDDEKPKWWNAIYEVLQDPNVTPKQSSDSMWALYNAVTRVEDYRETTEVLPESRLERVWFGRGAEKKIKALETAIAMCEVGFGVKLRSLFVRDIPSAPASTPHLIIG
jgi:phage/plasmid-like protein (TIGR03299 family)